MIRLYLNTYHTRELGALYMALQSARAEIPDNNRPAKDLDEALAYLSGYMDSKVEVHNGER